MTRVEHEIHIERPVEEVFAFAADPWQVPKWQPAVVWMRQTTPGSYGLGSRISQTRQLAGRRFDLVVECSAFEPNRVLGMRIVSGPVSGSMVTRFAADGSGTRLRVEAQVFPRGILRLVGEVMAGAARHELVSDCLRLKRLLESHPAERPN